MLSEEKTVRTAVVLVFIFFLGFAFSVNIPALQKNFLYADEATYYAITQSLAQDYDLEYTKRDIIRYYQTFDAGPLGIFLKRVKKNGQDHIYFAKSSAYPLFAAPFVKVFGYSGFFILHALLLLLLLCMGYAYLSRLNGPALSLGFLLTFLFASVACVYLIWIAPDFFNLVLVFSILFLWLYKHQPNEKKGEEPKPGRLGTFLLSDWSDYLASLLVGIAVFSKPPNIVLMGPLVLHTLLRKRFGKAALMILVFTATVAFFFGSNYLVTGEWNYQGGERKTFVYAPYPLEKEGVTFDSVGGRMSSKGYAEKHLYPVRFVFINLAYYFFGRFSGITWYFFPAVLALILFFARRKRLYQWLIFATLFGEILIYIYLMPDNFAGGAGSVGNRYFLNIYPLFFFLPAFQKNIKEVALNWIVASLFLSSILVNPLPHSHYPASHAKKFPFKWLPVEMTLCNNFPTNTNPNAFRQIVGIDPNVGYLHMLDDNFHPRTVSQLESRGFWTVGDKTAEMVLKTYYPIDKLTFRILNNPRMRNTATVKVGGETKKTTLGTKQWGTLEFSRVRVFNVRSLYLTRIKIKASKGAIPFFEKEQSLEKRNLGIYFEIDITPKK